MTRCSLHLLFLMCIAMAAPGDAVSETAYGTLAPSCVLRLVHHFHLNKNDIVVDLGSGVGNVCRDVSPFVSSCVGYEIDEVRYNISQRLVSSADMRKGPYTRYTEGLHDFRQPMPANVDFFLRDFRTLTFVRATVVIVHSTVFSASTMHRISDIVRASPSVRLVISQKAMDIDDEVDLVECTFSWSVNSFINHTMKGYKLK